MGKHKAVYLLAALFLLCAIAVPLRYTRQHSMFVAGSFEAGSSALEPRVLIATQGSSFKNALVDGLLAELKPRTGYLKVIDVANLSKIQEKEWAAIVVLHTWEYGKPQADAAAFVGRASEKRKLIVVTTSGGGAEKMPGIDAISAASAMRQVPAGVAEVTGRIESLLKKRPPEASP